MKKRIRITIITVLFILAAALLLASGRGGVRDTGDKITIPLSAETKVFLDTKPDFGKSMFSEDGWNNTTLPSVICRETGYLEMPTVDGKTGKTIVLENKVTDRRYGEAHVYTFSPSNEPECIIMYVHGGGYIANGDAYHERLCDLLCSSLSAGVILPFYCLAPQGTYKDAYKLLHEVYADIVKSGKPVYIMGDSAGGGLAEGFVMDLKEKSVKLPDKVVLISPWTDMTMTNTEIDKYERDDPMLSKYGTAAIGTFWSDGDDEKNYRLSPLYGDVKGMPETLITVGTNEIFYPDIKLLYEKYRKNNESCICIEGTGMFHAFPLMKDSFSESMRCVEMIIDFLKADAK